MTWVPRGRKRGPNGGWEPIWVEEDDVVTPQDKDIGAAIADAWIEQWARCDWEREVLFALSVGHSLSEAARIAEVSRARAEGLLRRIHSLVTNDSSLSYEDS